MTQEELDKRQFGLAPFTWYDFRDEVLKAIKEYYGYYNVDDSDKCIKLKSSNSHLLPADIIPCAEYRHYNNSREQAVGMTFWTKSFRQIINYPKLHKKNGSAKNSRTHENYKSTIRIFKNARNRLESKSSQFPSYFLECLLYNISDRCYGNSYAQTFESVLRELYSKRNFGGLETFVTQNEQDYLFGFNNWQASKNDAVELIDDLVELWDNW